MRSQLVSIGAILLSTAFLVVGSGLVATLTPLRAQLDGFSGVAIGAMGSFTNAGFVIGCLVGPRMLARVGHVRTFAVGAALTAATILLQALFVAPGVWFAARAAFGFCAAGVIMALESWLNDRATNQTRGRILAAYVTVNLGCSFLGQWLLLAAPIAGFQLFSIAAIVYMCCVVPVGLTRLPQPLPPTVPALRIRRVMRAAPVGVAGVITVGLANSAVWTLAPVYAHSLGSGTSGVAWFMSAFILGGALIQWPLSRYSDAFDRRWIAAGVCSATAIAGAALALLGGAGSVDPTLRYSLAFIFGAAMLPLYALSVTHSNDRTDRSEFVEVSASLLLINGVASIAGPSLASLVMARAGTPALFLYTAVIDAIMAMFAVWRIAIVESVPESARERFVPVPQQMSPESAELDPRGRDDARVEAA